MRKVIIILCILAGFVTLFQCKSSQKQAENTINEEGISPEVVKARDEYFATPAQPGEVFRIFVTSEHFFRKQLAYSDKVSVKEDPAGDQSLSEEFKKYDMINDLQTGLIRVELYPNSGKFYRIRQARPSKMKETDKLMSDDLTRWQFKFVKDDINPKDFKVGYCVMLRSRITREQAIKILTKDKKK